MAPVVKLHAKLYRARAIELAMALCRSEEGLAQLSRRREGDYHLVQCEGLDRTAAQQLLARLGDAALVFTVDQEKDAASSPRRPRPAQ